MTPAEHLEKAEYLQGLLNDDNLQFQPGGELQLIMEIISHAVMALAIELGVPHVTPPAEGASSAG